MKLLTESGLAGTLSVTDGLSGVGPPPTLTMSHVFAIWTCTWLMDGSHPGRLTQRESRRFFIEPDSRSTLKIKRDQPPFYEPNGKLDLQGRKFAQSRRGVDRGVAHFRWAAARPARS